MSRGMSRGGSFPIIIAILGTLIIAVIAIFVYLQFAGGNDDNALSNNDALPTATLMATPTPMVTPTPSPEPTPEVTPPPVESTPEVTIAPTATPYITPPPIYASATIAQYALNVRSDPSLSSAKIGKVRYGTICTVVDETSSWLKIEFNGGYGWIYAKPLKDGSVTVVRGGAPLPAPPEPEAHSLVKSWGTVNGTNSQFKVTITFVSGVFSDEACTGAIQANDFSASGGTISGITNNAADTQSVTLTIVPASGSNSVKVTINKNAIFTKGDKDGGSSHSYTVPGAPTPAPQEGAGAISEGNCSVSSGNAEITSVNHQAGNSTVYVFVKTTTDLKAGDTIRVTINAYAKDATKLTATGSTQLEADTASGTGNIQINVNFSEAAYKTTIDK